jgi:uncharacterized protein (TIGR00299 family) protein
MSPLHIHLDTVGGVAGDMFIAAVCAAFPELRAGMLAALQHTGLPPDVQCWFAEHADHALTGLRFLVHDPHDEAHRQAHVRGLHHPHDERAFADIRAALLASGLEPEVKQRAVAIFSLLAEVEGEIHGVPAEQVSFHELGGNDSIADIVGAAYLIAGLPGATWSVSPLPLGRGRVKTAHGMLPVPAPAAARLLQGFDFVDDGVEGERVTPTGAAILKHLGASRGVARAPRRLTRTGHGFGTRTFPELSNVLRALVFERPALQGADDSVALIAFEVDDQSPEDLAIALDHLRAHPGVLDVLQIPAFGKKGRMLAHLQILADPGAAEDVFEACFDETTTLGLRWQVVERRVLARRQKTVQLEGRSVRVKVAERLDTRTAKAESDDLLALSGGRAVREQARRAAEDEGLRRADEEGSRDDG